MKKLYTLLCFLISLFASAQTINFPDPVFKQILVEIDNSCFGYCARDINGNFMTIDSNEDGEIQLTEAYAVYELLLEHSNGGAYVTDVTGIDNFINLRVFENQYGDIISLDLTNLTHLEEINCFDNQLSNLHISNLHNLKKLNCADNNLTELDLSGLTNLESLDCGYNEIYELDFSASTHLKFINVVDNLLTEINLLPHPNLSTIQCDMNNLSSVDVSNLENLTQLTCFNNNITSIGLSNLPNILFLDCSANQLSEIDCSSMPKLSNFYCRDNLLTSLDASQNSKLSLFFAKNNLLKNINIKNGSATVEWLELDGNPELEYICADENEIELISDYITPFYINCQIGSYCSFVPGGEYYTVSGTTSFSVAGNCNADTTTVPFQAFTVTSEQNSGTVISNTSGNYSIPVIAGIHTFTALNPNPDYYVVSPESISLTFPNELDPYTQNFCISPIGTFNDLEVTLLPITPARPGFDAKYRLIYRNKGTTEQFAGVFFTFNESVLDFVSSTVGPNTNDSGSLFWEFNNLKPFEEGVIDIVLNVNSPVETPAININDILTFEANIQNPIPEAVEQTPSDNTYALHQTVIGSLDPNDKTCVEGTTITPDMAGEYVTYLIRFENTGSYHAENVVVKDIIDADKFEISSLQPLQSSHPYVTRINGNTTEFIFENIMLPGAPSEDRHGFVAFKIKTKATLQLDDTFSNTAAIYFDFNPPVITNEAITTLAVLGTDDFNFAENISLYPNPASTVLNIDVKNTLFVRSFEVYNIMGQRVIEVQNTANSTSIDIARLAAGTYMLKANTDKGSSQTKFIKQ